MKKKILILAIVLVVTLTFLSACNGKVSKACETVTDLLQLDYSEITVNVTTTTSNATLSGRFTLTFDGDTTNVQYSYDKLTTFDWQIGGEMGNFGVIIPDDDWITTVSGSLVVKGDQIVNGSDNVDLPLDKIDFLGFSFKEAFFQNVTATKSKFDADVTNPQGFTGNDLTSRWGVEDMHVNVVYGDYISRMQINYTTEGTQVEIVYNFTK